MLDPGTSWSLSVLLTFVRFFEHRLSQGCWVVDPGRPLLGQKPVGSGTNTGIRRRLWTSGEGRRADQPGLPVRPGREHLCLAAALYLPVAGQNRHHRRPGSRAHIRF